MKALYENLRRGAKPRHSPVAANCGEKSSVLSKAFRYSQLVALRDRLAFPNIFVPENERTLVHLAQAVQEYRNIDFLIFILVFEWLESTVEKCIFYAIN